ncbi:ATP-binding cassette domain-containing protein [Rhodoferax sp.]|uniref:ATP-binding cassette domain-containing protein n=1 Tax=Rhodoferax sp. TaxID=50421 RepID=UPI00345BF8B0
MRSGKPQSFTELLWGKMGSRISSLSRQCLVVSSVSRHFAGIQAITDVSASFGGCEIVSIVGSNGAGKTSLLNTISGIYMSDSVQIAIDRIDTTHARPPPIAASSIARTLQNIALLRGDRAFGEARRE